MRSFCVGGFALALRLVCAASPFGVTSPSTLNVSAADIITRDVCIIGGGSAGTYTAVRLSNMNQSVVVVERNDRLGGHTNTYVDPSTNTTWDYGVQIWHNLSIVTNYFARLNVALTPANQASSSAGPAPIYADFGTGQTLVNFSFPNATAALAAYSEQIAKYSFLNGGFDLPNPVPADLLLPFGDFVDKYGLGAMVDTAFLYGQTLGNLLQRPTIYVIKLFGQDILRNLLANSFLTTASHDNSQLYQSALALLGNNVLLQTSVLQTSRTADGVQVLVQTPSGHKLIQAKKLVVAIPQYLENLIGFDLDENEISIFGQLDGVGYFTGLFNNTGLPAGQTVMNFAPNTPYNLPLLPGTFGFTPTSIPDVFDFKYGSIHYLSDDAVKAEVVASLSRLRNTGLNVSNTPDFVAYQNHSPYVLSVSAAAIQDGYYDRLKALQGVRNTWYTGAAFVTQDSSLIWNFTESLLPRIVGGG